MFLGWLIAAIGAWGRAILFRLFVKLVLQRPKGKPVMSMFTSILADVEAVVSNSAVLAEAEQTVSDMTTGEGGIAKLLKGANDLVTLANLILIHPAVPAQPVAAPVATPPAAPLP
jgi:hypothetical protein